ncbi:MAG: MMPL family transporter [Candidatus Ornithospirochaeta sp.]|nr:MMPL family transporter [Candidatus Ornithospirochaeta sp.]
MKSANSIFKNATIAFFVLLVAGAIVSCIISPRSFSTSFTSMIPQGGIPDSILEAEKVFSERQNASASFIVKGSSFSEVRDATLSLYEEISNTGFFESLSLAGNSFDIHSMQSMMSQYAPLLIDKQTREEILSDPLGYQEKAISTIFGAFTLSSLSNLDSDPFLLEEAVWQEFLSKASSLTPFSPKEGILFSQGDDCVYSLMTGTLSKNAMSIAGNLSDVFRIGDRIEKEHEGIRVYYSGIAFHSNESATNAQKEITIITVLSVILIVIVFIVICRKLSIIGLFLFSLIISITSALSSLVIFFREIHIVTLLFGTTLIGTCIDYSIHSYAALAENPRLDGRNAMKKISKDLTVSFLSTATCYLLLFFADYSILKEMAVFSFFGMLSSYLTAMFLYPELLRRSMVDSSSYISKPSAGVRRKSLLPFIALASSILMLTQLGSVRIENNVSSLYTPSERLLESEIEAAKAMGYASASYAIIEAENEEELMEKEHLFVTELEGLIRDGKLGGILASSTFIPPVSEQRASLEAARSLLVAIDDQCAILGISDQHKNEYIERIESEPVFLTPGSAPEAVASLLSSIYLGKINDGYYSVVILRNATDSDAIKKAADRFEGVEFIQISEDTSRHLDELTRTILKLFATGSVLILIALLSIYGIRRGLRMALAPFSIILGTVAIQTIAGESLDFFFAVGLVMIIGLGLDYIVFASSKNGSRKAITLSFITTELSFGTLIFSSFKPVHTFGFTVFTGILIAYICAIGAGDTE